jgi:hypothetical protein
MELSVHHYTLKPLNCRTIVNDAVVPLNHGKLLCIMLLSFVCSFKSELHLSALCCHSAMSVEMGVLYVKKSGLAGGVCK